MRYRLAEIAARIGGEVVGNPEKEISGINSLEAAGPDELSFAEEKYLPQAAQSRAGALLVPRQADRANLKMDLILCDRPFQAAGLIMTEIDEANQALPATISPAAVIGENVRLGKNLHIGPGAVIGDNVEIADGCRIYAHTWIGRGVRIGSGCRIYPGVVIRENCVLGSRVIIHPNSVIGSDGFGFLQVGGKNVKIPQVGRVVIEDDVEIGALCTINRAALDETVIGRGSKLDDHVHLGHGVKVGQEAIMCAQVGISGSVKIGNQVMLGPRVGTVDHITIGDQARLMANTSTAKDLEGGQDYGGIPAVPVKQFLRQAVALTRLPQDRNRLAALEKKVRELEKALAAQAESD